MKNSILGFKQEEIFKTDTEDNQLDLVDLVILNYIISANGRPSMYHICVDDDKNADNKILLVWLDHTKIMSDLPILRLTKRGLERRLTNLLRSGFIVSKQIQSKKRMGTRVYYGITEKTENLIYDKNTENKSKPDNNHLHQNVSEHITTCTKMQVNEGSVASECNSYNLLTNNNKLNNTISKDIVSETESNDNSNTNAVRNISKLNDSNEYVSKEYNNDSKKKEDKAKGLNLYQKCVNLINEFTDDEDIRQLLDVYLRMRLSMRDKPMYGVNQWKGLLNKLALLKGNIKDIIQYSTERGYASFYAPQKYQCSTRMDKSIFGENEDNRSDKVTREELNNGYFTGEVL